MRVALANLDEGDFTEGHELDRKWKVAKQMIGRRLTQKEAKRLLAKLPSPRYQLDDASKEAYDKDR